MNDIKNATIVYYSGTGSTRKVAGCFEDSLKNKNVNVENYCVTGGKIPDKLNDDLLMVIFAVHAFNAPEAICKWIMTLPKVNNKRAAVISVSGGGETCPNTACRTQCIKLLKKKGYHIYYETMLVMPSNWIVSTNEALAVRLLDVLPERVDRAVAEILTGKERRTNPLLIDRVFSRMGSLEKMGAKEFGKRIKCNENCVGCGLCANGCPARNIRMEAGKPVFGAQCHMCLNCLYGCPQKALKPGFIEFIIIKEGYNLKELEKKQPWTGRIDLDELAKGFFWAGVKKYLKDD